MRKLCGSLLLLALAALLRGQTLDQLSSAVVFLQSTVEELKDGKMQPVLVPDADGALQPLKRFGTGFLVAYNDNDLFLVTAQHVANIIKTQPTATVRGANDLPISVPLEDLFGQKGIKWVFHDKEDIAVGVLHPSEKLLSTFQAHFLTKQYLSPDKTAPSRDRFLTALGFPLALGVEGHFSPISRESKPVSGFLELPRSDTHKPATFFLLDNPSIGGFSGAPLFRLPGMITVPNAWGLDASPPVVVGLINATIADETGGKMAAVTPVTQNPKTDTEEIRGKLGQKSGRGDEDDAQEWSHGRADRGGIAAGGSGGARG